MPDAIRRAVASLPAPVAPPSARFQLRDGDLLFEDFQSFDKWRAAGQAFGDAPVNGVATSSRANELVGSLTSKKFRVPKFYLHVLVSGTKRDSKQAEKTPLRLTLVADDYKAVHFAPDGKPGFTWQTERMTLQHERMSYFEIVDRDVEGHIAVDAIVFSDHKDPPPLEPAVEATAVNPPGVAVPLSLWAMSSRDGNPHNIRLNLRGNHKNLGDEVPRHFLRIVPSTDPPQRASGRLELAAWIASSRNPLTARVMVNRIWKHHFGAGLVRTTDNFGRTGERPSNPELLDWLAQSFVDSGWSVKQLHRTIVLSGAYAMSSREDPSAHQTDPRNDMLHHFPVQRLEAEAIRDTVLAVSGALDRALYGTAVPANISKYQDGRGKPVSGPLDGNRRRGIYLEVRRNFLTPMFLAFDYPLPVSTIGVRGVSTVPSQALMMMNNEFIAEQAALWARRVEREEPDAAKRLDRMFLEAFGRTPEDWELRETLAFAAKSGWPSLAHVLFNSAEFIYVR